MDRIAVMYRRESNPVMRRVVQQPGVRNCGQIAVAVIAGVPVWEAEAVVGHNRGTSTRTLKKALAHFGYHIPAKAARFKTPPKLAIAQVRWEGYHGRRWHWVVVDEDRVWDGGQYGSDDGTWNPPERFRITSYLPVTPLY